MLTKVPKQSYHYSPEHDAKVTLQVTAYGQRPRGIEASQGKKKGADGPCLRQIFSVSKNTQLMMGKYSGIGPIGYS